MFLTLFAIKKLEVLILHRKSRLSEAFAPRDREIILQNECPTNYRGYQLSEVYLLGKGKKVQGTEESSAN